MEIIIHNSLLIVCRTAIFYLTQYINTDNNLVKRLPESRIGNLGICRLCLCSQTAPQARLLKSEISGKNRVLNFDNPIILGHIILGNSLMERHFL